MSETPTGTDRVELTEAEFATVPHLSQLDSYADARDIKKAVERLLAARVQALREERDRLRLAVEDQAARKNIARRSESDVEAKYLAAVGDRDAARAELAAANARCAELEKQREALSFELQALRATPWHQRMEKAEATLDRATAALRDFRDFGIRADLNPTINAANPPDYGWWSAYLRRADERVRDRARAALTPEGKPQ